VLLNLSATYKMEKSTMSNEEGKKGASGKSDADI